MKKWIPINLLIAGLLSGKAMSSPLSAEVFTSNPGGFLATSTLISGEKETVLIDAQFTRSAAHRLTAKILESGKKLSRVFITHAHPDHYFGLEIIKRQFPAAKFYAKPEVVQQMRVLGPQKVAIWKPLYGDNLTGKPIIPQAFSAGEFQIEGQKVQVMDLKPGEIEHSTVFYIPSLKTVVAGDAVYSGVHVWLAETNTQTRKTWLDNLNRIAELKPTRVIGGHQGSELKDSVSAIKFTAQYIRDFNQILEGAKTSDEAKAAMLKKYPKLQLPVILDFSLKAAYGSKSDH